MKKLLLHISIYFFVAIPLLSQIYSPSDSLILRLTDKFKDILILTRGNYVGDADLEKMSHEAFKAMLGSLDKYSTYFPAESFSNVKEKSEGTRLGFGFYYMTLRDTIFIYNVLNNSPADSAGLSAGDRILSINGNNLSGKNRANADSLILGEEGSIATIKVQKFNSNKIIEKRIKRLPVPISSITVNYKVQDKVAFLRCNTFSINTDKDFKVALAEHDSLDVIFIDLRGNMGGDLESAALTNSLFLDSNQRVLSTTTKNDIYKLEKFASTIGKYSNATLIVLTDGNTASAGELFAANVQDYDKGLVIGSKTLGKSSVQRQWEFPEGDAFRLTVALYTSGLGRSLERYKSQLNGNLEIDPSLELRVGSQQAKAVTDAVNKLGSTQADVYQSISGRPILSFGGVFPDLPIADDTLSLLTQVLDQKSIFKDWALRYLEANYESFHSKFYDFYQYDSEFIISDEMLSDFYKISAGEYSTWNMEMFENDKLNILLYMKAEIAQLLWGFNGKNYVLRRNDSAFLSALKNINKAKEIKKRNSN